MPLNISPGEGEIAQEPAVTIDSQVPVAENTENSPAPVEEFAAEAIPDSVEEGAVDASVAENAEQVSPEAQAADSQPAAEAAQETPLLEVPASPASSDAVKSDDGAHDLLDELEDLIGRAHHFENAGIERLRAGGLALIERIRAVV